MERWSVTYRLPGAVTDRIEVEATSPMALAAAKRLLPESAEIVGYRVIEGVPASGLKAGSPRARPRTILKATLARIIWPFSK
jgi:hypothetical protein